MLSLVALGTAILLGSMLFFAIIVTPNAFKFLDKDIAGEFLRALFPRFYLWGLIISAIVTLLALLSGSATSILLIIVLTSFIYCRQTLTPKINQAREQWLSSDTFEHKTRFRQLHKRSVAINIVQMVILLLVSTSIVWRIL